MTIPPQMRPTRSSMLDVTGPSGRTQAMDLMQRSVLALQLAHLTREFASARPLLDNLRREAAAVSVELENGLREQERLRLEIEAGEARVAALYASTSWRLSAPLRALSLQPKSKDADRSALPAITSPADTSRVQETGPVSGSVIGQASASAVASKTIFVVADHPPLHDQSAGGLRLQSLIRLMGQAGWTIQFGSFFTVDALPGVLGTVAGRASYEASLRDDGVVGFHYGLAAIDSYLKHYGHLLDWAFLSFPAVAAEVLPLVRCRCPTVLVAYDMVDFHGLRMAREAVLRDDKVLADSARLEQARELSCIAASDITVAVTDMERDTLRELLPTAPVIVIPCFYDVPTVPIPPLEPRRDLLFIGGFWHTPNADAMLWFTAKIWPLVRLNEPDAVLRIVGANPTKDVLELASIPGVEVLGFVPDLSNLFAAHRVFVAPLRYGAGMKGKVAQSLAMGLPVVGTPVAAEGMGLSAGEHILVAETPALFADHIVRLMRDDYLWRKLSEQGRQHIDANFSTDVIRKHLLSLLEGGSVAAR